jgi:hypothetical protein
MEETLPSNAVQGGYDNDFKPLFIGRLRQPDNTLVLGKVINGTRVTLIKLCCLKNNLCYSVCVIECCSDLSKRTFF